MEGYLKEEDYSTSMLKYVCRDTKQLPQLIVHWKERKYFDSGDFALSTADRVTDIGAINTGRAHPQRGSVSHPYAPVPSSSNANEDANKDVRDKAFAGLKMTESPLHQQSDVGDTKKQKLEKPKSD
jgi:hypothetical protein